VPAAGARGMRALLALLALAVLLPGCIQPAAQGPLDPASAKAALDATVAGLLAGVPCVATGVPADKTSENLKPLAQVEYGTPGIHGEIDARGDWLLAARYADGGFEVVSVADPLHPQKVATYQSQEKSAYDVKWMPDNRSAVVGHTATIDLVDVSPVVAANLSADEIERAGVAPRLVSVFTYPTPATAFPDTNMHMLTTARIAGKDYVFVAPNDNTGVWVLQLSGEGDARKLVPVGQVGDVPLGGGPLGPHDMSLVWDEILHKPVLYVANGFEGWGAYDVSDPKSPQMLALVPNLGPAQGYTHTVVGQKVGDRRLVAMIQEVGSNWLSIYDATSFQTPILLAQWHASDAMPASPEHNIQIVGDKLYVAHYSHGVYVFNLSALGGVPLADTATIAPMAHLVPKDPAADGATAFDNVWDVIVHRGLLYVNDVKAGTSVVGFGCLAPGDEAQSSAN